MRLLLFWKLGLKLKEYKNQLKTVSVKAASLPQKVAFDDPDGGGLWTQWKTKRKKAKYLKKLYRSKGYIASNNKHKLHYHTPTKRNIKHY